MLTLKQHQMGMEEMGQAVQKPRPWDKTSKTEFSGRGITEQLNGADLLERPVLMAGSPGFPQSSQSAGECMSLRPFSNLTVATLIQYLT